MMKRYIGRLVLTMAFLLALAVPAGRVDAAITAVEGEASGEEGAGAPVDGAGFATIDELFTDWEMNGYPDNVGGVYWDDGIEGIVVMLVNNSPEAQSEIQEQVAEPVHFEGAVYSYNALLAAQEELTVWQQTLGDRAQYVYGHGIGWGNQETGKGWGESGREFRLLVSVDPAIYEEVRTELAGRFGDMVVVETGDEVVPVEETLGVGDTSGRQGADWMMILLIGGLVVIAAAAGALIYRRKFVVVPAEGVGEDGMTSGSQDLLEQIRRSGENPPASVRDRIDERIRK